jgi:hypothetical protein
LPLRFLYNFLILLSSLPAIGLCSDDCRSTCFLAGYRSLVNSSRILQLIVTIRARSVQVRDYLNSSCTTSRLTRSQSSRPLPGRLETRRQASIRPVSTVFLIRRLRSIGLTNKTSKRSTWDSPGTSCTSKLRHFDCRRWMIVAGVRSFSDIVCSAHTVAFEIFRI